MSTNLWVIARCFRSRKLFGGCLRNTLALFSGVGAPGDVLPFVVLGFFLTGVSSSVRSITPTEPEETAAVLFDLCMDFVGVVIMSDSPLATRFLFALVVAPAGVVFEMLGEPRVECPIIAMAKQSLYIEMDNVKW